MEILYASLVGLVLILVIYLFYNHKSSGNNNLPPGKTGFPVIGETLEFLSTGWKGHPEKFIFDRVAKYSSYVFKTSLLGSPVFVFCGLKGHRFLFSNEKKLVQLWLPRSFEKIFMQSTRNSPMEECHEIANVVRNFFRPVVLQGHIGLMDSIAHCYFVTYWEKKDTIVVLPLAKHYTFLLACRLLMSVKDPNLVALLEKPYGLLINGLVSLPIDLPGTPFNRAIKASNFLKKELLVIVKQRKIDLVEGRASPNQDVLSRMLSTRDDNGNVVPEVDIASKIFGLLFASNDYINSACTSIVKYLAELPEVYQGVYHEQLEIAKSKAPGELLNWEDIEKMKYSWNVAREVMRLAPPSPGSFREALKDFTYDGFSVPKGCKILDSK